MKPVKPRVEGFVQSYEKIKCKIYKSKDAGRGKEKRKAGNEIWNGIYGGIYGIYHNYIMVFTMVYIKIFLFVCSVFIIQ